MTKEIKWHYCEGATPPPITRHGLSADIMIEYYGYKGHVLTSRGRCFRDAEYASVGSFYVYEYNGEPYSWHRLEPDKAIRWYHLGGETTKNNSNPVLFGFNCKLSFPRFSHDLEEQSDILLISWKNKYMDNPISSLGFYSRDEGFCIFKTYQPLYDEYICINEDALTWLVLEHAMNPRI